MKKIITKTNIKVPFYDLDPMNIVWHGNYVKYLEIARCDFFAKIGYNYFQMKDDGYVCPIAKMDFKFIKSAKFEDELVVETILQELEPAIILKYNIYCKEEKLLSATTMQICVNIETGESAYNAPKKLLERVENFEA